MTSMDVTFENVRIMWKNFSGRKDEFNSDGKRYFSIVITDEMAEQLRNVELTTKSGVLVKGANVKLRLPKDGEGDAINTLKVNFGTYPPEDIQRIVPNGRMHLTMDTVGCLDREYIEKAKVMVTLFAFEKGPNRGITAYLKKIAVWVREDDFDSDYRDIPEIGAANYGDDEENVPF